MNKAFVREPDSTEERCPRCGAIGEPVRREVLDNYVIESARDNVALPANFCPTPLCEVAYFDVFERVILTSALTKPVYPKDLDAPMCACFGFTRDEIEQDLAEGTNVRTKACVLKAKSPAAQCHVLAANGRSCVMEVQRYFVQNKKT
jgi:hypothetical protein